MEKDEDLVKGVWFSFGAWILRQGRAKEERSQGPLVVRRKTEMPKWLFILVSMLHTEKHRPKKITSTKTPSNGVSDYRLIIR